MNEDSERDYRANRLTVTRQLHYSTEHNKSLDMVLSGIPVATAELKNQFTGQTVKEQKHSTKPFATRARKSSASRSARWFISRSIRMKPGCYAARRRRNRSCRLINQGNGKAAGNPENPNGYKTAYLWERIWTRDSWMELLGRFLHLETVEKIEGGKKIRKEALIFPATTKLTPFGRSSRTLARMGQASRT